MRPPALGRLRRRLARLACGGPARAVVLLYHRVADVRRDPWRLCVGPARFEEQLAALSRVARPIALGDLVQALRAGRCPRRAVVVTFDDGYADNLHHARPLLARHGVPATVFVAAGQLGSAREFWWDDLERILFEPPLLPPVLAIEVDGAVRRWELGAAAQAPTSVAGECDWEPWGTEHPSARHRLYAELWSLLHPLDAGVRGAILDWLAAWAGLAPEGRPGHRALTPEEVQALSRDGLVEIGCHTVTHTVLSALPVAEQREEIARSKATLEEIIGRSVTSFAYPYGRREDYTAETVALVRAGGFESACANVEGVVVRDTALFELPRMQVRDWDGDVLAGRLDAWLGEG